MTFSQIQRHPQCPPTPSQPCQTALSVGHWAMPCIPHPCLSPLSYPKSQRIKLPPPRDPEPLLAPRSLCQQQKDIHPPSLSESAQLIKPTPFYLPKGTGDTPLDCAHIPRTRVCRVFMVGQASPCQATVAFGYLKMHHLGETLVRGAL